MNSTMETTPSVDPAAFQADVLSTIKDLQKTLPDQWPSRIRVEQALDPSAAVVPGLLMPVASLFPSSAPSWLLGLITTYAKMQRKFDRWFGHRKVHKIEEAQQHVNVSATAVANLLVPDPSAPKGYTVRSDLRTHLCPALRSVSGDVFDIAKITTPILLSLALAGTIVLPVEPFAFALLAIIISRSGIAALCAEYQPEKKSDK